MARRLAHQEPPADPRAVRLVRRTVPVALKDAINAARKVAIAKALPQIAAALEREAWFNNAGARRALPKNNPKYTAQKVALGFDKRRAHKTGALQKGIGDKRVARREETTRKVKGRRVGESITLAFRYLQPLMRKIQHIKHYRENKAEIGQPSSTARTQMANAAAKAYADRMNTALRAEGFRERVALTRGGEVVSR
jgi:hypothetical protein